MTGGLGLLLVLSVLALVFASSQYFGWRARDAKRRLERLMKRGLA